MYDPFERDPKKNELRNALNAISDTVLLQLQLGYGYVRSKYNIRVIQLNISISY